MDERKAEMINIISSKNVMNGKIISKEEAQLLISEAKIYEVVRVIEGKTIFLKEHFDRMNESIRLSGIKDTLNYEEFKNFAQLLIRENSFKNCNIRVSYLIKEEKPIILFYFVKSSYPSKDMFEEGIHTVTIKSERENPNIKSYQKDFRDNVAKIREENNAYEAILVNHDDTVGEGSRSNVFFVSGNRLVTPPDSAVLLGVTRSKVIEVSMDNSIEIEKRVIYSHELKDFDGAFITGTSNDVLAIRTIDSIVLNSAENDLVKKVSDLYLAEVKKEIEIGR